MMLFTHDVQTAFEQVARELHGVIMQMRCPWGAEHLLVQLDPFFPFLSEVASVVNIIDMKALSGLNFQSCFSFVNVTEVVVL